MKNVIKRIAILEIMALLATNMPVVGTFAAPNGNEFDISNGSITITAASGGYTIEQGGVQSIVNDPAVPVVSGNSEGGTLTILAENDNEAHVILKDLTINASQGDSPAITANCKAFIELQGDNFLKGGGIKAGLEHQDCNEDQVLRIDGAGTLQAEGGSSPASYGNGPAGIGGSSYHAASYIEINGGTVTSKGGYGGAGIGSGGNITETPGSHITINGGNVTAIGGSYAAGIGGGQYGAGSDITINGGIVTAQGGWSGGAGIGGGELKPGINIKITGGIVKATGGVYGAGIGGGKRADGSNITIEGGTVIAAGGDGAAGIGGGSGDDDGPYKYGTGSNIIISGSSAVKISGGGNYVEYLYIRNVTGAAIGSGGGPTKKGEEVMPDITGLLGGSVTYYPRGTVISDMENDRVTPLGSPHTVSFNANSGTDNVTVFPEKKVVCYGESDESIYGDLPSPTREGYRFDGWFTERAGGTEVKEETRVSLNDDQTLYAHWTRYEGYTITYQNDDGTVRRTQKYPTLNAGDDILDRSPDSREGYSFEGWKVMAASGNWVSGDVYNSRMPLKDKYGDITVSGQWDVIRYTVKFDANGGSGSMDDQDREYWDAKELPENRFTYDGHKFMGWSDLPNIWISMAPTQANFYPDKAKNRFYHYSLSTRLYALWEYTVAFDTDGGTDIEDQKYFILSDNTLPSAEKDGFAFRGWKAGFVNGSWIDGSIYDSGTALKGKYGDVRLTAMWEAVPEPFSIITSSLPEGKEGVSFDAVLKTNDSFSGSVTWSISSGSLPGGLSLNSVSDNTGHISGMPEESGEFDFTVAASTDDGVVCKEFRLTITKRDIKPEPKPEPEPQPEPKPEPKPKPEPEPQPEPKPEPKPEPEPQPEPQPKPEPEPQPEPELQPQPESANQIRFSRIKKTIVLSGLDPKVSEDTVITELGPSKPVSYNGRTHLWVGASLSGKKLKHKCADLDIAVNGLPGSVSSSFCYRGTKSSSDGKTCFYIRLRADKTTDYYRALSRDEKTKLIKAIREANIILKKKESRLYFPIEQMDLNDFIFDEAESHGNRCVFKRKNGNGDTLIVRRRRKKHVSPDGSEISYSYENTLTAYFSGVRCILPKGEYRRTVSGGIVTITGKNKSITGSMSGKPG